MSRGIAALALASIVLVALQVTVVSPLRIAGVVVMVVWMWPLALALTGTTVVAVVAGAVTGLLFDAHTITPFGLSAVVGALLALLISIPAREGVGDLDGSAWWMAPALLAIGGLLAPVLFVVSGALVGQTSFWRANLLTTMGINALAFLVLARPMARVARGLMSVGGWERG